MENPFKQEALRDECDRMRDFSHAGVVSGEERRNL